MLIFNKKYFKNKRKNTIIFFDDKKSIFLTRKMKRKTPPEDPGGSENGWSQIRYYQYAQSCGEAFMGKLVFDFFLAKSAFFSLKFLQNILFL